MADDQVTQSDGGFGGNLFQREKWRAADMKLVARAVKNGWNVRPELRKKILDRVELIVDAEQDEDLFLKASRIAIEADKIDLAASKAETDGDKQQITINNQVNVIDSSSLLAEYADVIQGNRIPPQDDSGGIGQ